MVHASSPHDTSGISEVTGGYFRGGLSCDTSAPTGAASVGWWGAAAALVAGWMRRRR